jgi:hypothetical protein
LGTLDPDDELDHPFRDDRVIEATDVLQPQDAGALTTGGEREDLGPRSPDQVGVGLDVGRAVEGHEPGGGHLGDLPGEPCAGIGLEVDLELLAGRQFDLGSALAVGEHLEISVISTRREHRNEPQDPG